MPVVSQQPAFFVKQNKHYEMRFKEPNREGYIVIKV